MQLSHAIWIINYPIVMPFDANRQVGEIEGVGGRGWGPGRVSLGQDVDFCGAATGLATILRFSCKFIAMHNVSGSWQRCVKYKYIGKGQNRSQGITCMH